MLLLALIFFAFTAVGVVRAGTIVDSGDVIITAQVGVINPGGGGATGDDGDTGGGGGGITGSVGFIIFPKIIETLKPFPDIVFGPVPKFCSRRADLNCDGAVNIIDFSILIYWFDRLPVPERVDLNRDGKVDIADFSVMAFYWTN